MHKSIRGLLIIEKFGTSALLFPARPDPDSEIPALATELLYDSSLSDHIIGRYSPAQPETVKTSCR